MRKIIDWPQHPLSKNSHDQTLLLSRSTVVPSSSINFTLHTFHLCSDKCVERYSLFINPSLMFKLLQINQAMKTSSAHQSSSSNIFGVWSFAGAPSRSQLKHTNLLSHLQTLAEQSSYENFISLPGLFNQHFWRLKLRWCSITQPAQTHAPSLTSSNTCRTIKLRKFYQPTRALQPTFLETEANQLNHTPSHLTWSVNDLSHASLSNFKHFQNFTTLIHTIRKK
jgi:hypothetical protein